MNGGTVYLVPAAEVAALNATPIDLQLSPAAAAALRGDEPLEDLIETKGASYTRGSVGADGVYRVATLPSGTYFVVWMPDAGDKLHLPGGKECRQARSSATLVNQQLDLHVSAQPSEDAIYVGSTACFSCHGRHRSMRTAHRNGLQVPGARGAYQDSSQWPKFSAALQKFKAGVTLYYSACNPAASGFSKCKVSETEPPTAVSFELRLRTDSSVPPDEPGAYYVEIVNRESGGGSARWDVVLTYGGAVYKQRFLTRRLNPNGSFSYLVLPVQYNFEGDPSAPSSNNWKWRDYHSAKWYDYTNRVLGTYKNQDAFDNNCAGCHFTGFELTGSATDGWSAHAVADANGDFDFDGDGRKEEINTGCESCHGPGSEHLERWTEGARILAPSKLTPERETMICGACHSRPQGLGGGNTDTPLSAVNTMPRPGIRRATFASDYTKRVDALPADLHASGDSKSHHQQYTDFVRTSMYRNGSTLMTCSSCHDAHGSDKNAHQLLAPAKDNTSCTSCHSDAKYTDVRTHVTEKTGNQHTVVADADFTCVGCHMTKTASSGAQKLQLVDAYPGTSTSVSYWHGDISSHRFNVPLKSVAALQPSAVTLACGSCHATFLANP